MKKKAAEEEVARKKALEQEEVKEKPMQSEIIVEEGEEEESGTIPTLPTGKRLSKEQIQSLVKEEIMKQVVNTNNKYVGTHLLAKSIFDHPEYELKERLPIVKNEAYI